MMTAGRVRKDVEMEGGNRRRRRTFTPEYWADVVAMCLKGERSVRAAAADGASLGDAGRDRLGEARRGDDVGAGRIGSAPERGQDPPRRAGHLEAGNGFLRYGDAVTVYPFIAAEKA